jgi:uncharacterized membrane protein
MTILTIGLALFLGVHFYSAFRSRESGKDIKEKIGNARYMGLYSLVSLAGLALIIWGYSIAEVTQNVFQGFSGARNVVFLLMMPALILILSADMPKGYIKASAKHPMLIAVALWSIAHIVDGADLKQLLLFGSFLLYSVVDIIAVSRRKDNDNKAYVEPNIKNDILVLVVATLAYFALVYWLHGWLFGFSLSM